MITSIAYLGQVDYNRFTPSLSDYNSELASLKIKLIQNEIINEKIHKQSNCNKTVAVVVEQKYNFLKKYPHVTDCNINYEADQNVNDYSKPAPDSTHSLRIVRGILVYFPIEKYDNFILEFKWMYRSWLEMQKHEPSNWRTDIIVFLDTSNQKFKETGFFMHGLNCSTSNSRSSQSDDPMCTIIDYVSIQKRNINYNPKFKSERKYYEYLLENVDIFSDDEINLAPFYKLLKDKISSYGYVDSILMAFDGYNYLKKAGYNFLIRSDMDVFFTPLFATWLPKTCNDFYVGRGGFSSTFNVKRLARIANDLGLQHAGIQNLGSTWYSTPDQLRLVAYTTLFGMIYISEEEFSGPEREGKLGVILWPHWHYGVLLLYGQSLALNHLIASNQIKVTKLEEYLDYPSHYEKNINKILHIHVFHGDDMFSKFQFKAGKYDQYADIPGDINSGKYYSLKMALDGKRLSSSKFIEMLKENIAKKT